MKLEILKYIHIYKESRIFNTRDSKAKMLCSGRMVALFCSVFFFFFFFAYLNSIFFLVELESKNLSSTGNFDLKLF